MSHIHIFHFKDRTCGMTALFDFLRELAKLLGLFVTGLYLQLCELSRCLPGLEQDQGFKFQLPPPVRGRPL